jgi:hypothetical protein
MNEKIEKCLKAGKTTETSKSISIQIMSELRKSAARLILKMSRPQDFTLVNSVFTRSTVILDDH